nr:Toxin [Paraburkholderia busanensis]
MLKGLPNRGTEVDATSGVQFGVPLAYTGKPSGPLRADPATPGVYRADNGQAYIKQGGQMFAVKYDGDNRTWRVYSPDNPAKYAYPVKQDESGNWHAHGDVGLPGGFRGAPPAGIGWGQHAVLQLQQQVQHLQNQQAQLQQEHQNLHSQLQQFPGPQHANRSPAELAQLQGMLQSQLGNVTNQLQAVNQQIQQANQQLVQLQNELQH